MTRIRHRLMMVPAQQNGERGGLASQGSEIRFTPRQRQVAELLAAGCSTEEMARRLGISPRTAKAHCDVLRHKLGVSRRRQIPVAYRLLTGNDPLLWLSRREARDLWRSGAG